MCGIAGVAATDIRRFNLSAGTLHHRGPDGHGAWSNERGTVALHHSRLSIIDPSAAAAQPLHYGGRYTIIHNGELYNYKELRQVLLSKGYTFASSSDTEVIAAAYALFGEACLQYFDGMFAFAIWDEQEQTLFAARDRFGEKPLFFSYAQDALMFASEMKALWDAGIEKEVNKAMLYNFFTIGYVQNPHDPTETFYSHILKLPAASYLTYQVAKNELSIHQYWQLYTEPDNDISEGDAIEKFRHLFSRSVKRRLRSDVPVGTSLSGGLDSSSIVAYCSKHATDAYSHKSFTIAFRDFEKDESSHAALVAAHYNLQHFTTTLGGAELPDLMEKVMHHQEEPFSSSSVLAQYKIYELARQHGVSVLLDGQGADEVLGGYHKYYKWYWRELYRVDRTLFKREIRAARQLGVGESFGWLQKISALFPDMAAGLQQIRKEKQAATGRDLNKDFAHEYKKLLRYTLPPDMSLSGTLHFNTVVNGLEELLRYADRNSMAHAVEVRLPFLEKELVEFLFQLPAHFKIRDGWTKWLLRKTMDDTLPHQITWRRDKVGLEPPQKLWMTHQQVQEAMIEGRRKLVRANILSPHMIQKPIIPRGAHEAFSNEWKYWSASCLL